MVPFSQIYNLLTFPFSSSSAFVPYKRDSLEKTKRSVIKLASQASTVSQDNELPTEVLLMPKILKTSDTNFHSLEQKLQKKQRKGSLKLKKGNDENDYQYRPHKRLTKKEPNSKLNQNRNILPNTIHQLFSFAQRRNRSGKLVQKIFKIYYKKEEYCNKQDPSVTRFYIYQKLLKNKIGNYVTEETLKMVCNNQISPQLFDWEEERFYNKVFRILIFSYLNEEANCSVMMSKRMYNDKKIQHIKTNRYIAQRMRQNFKSQGF